MDGRDCGGVSRRAADAQVFHLLDQAGLVITERWTGVALLRFHFLHFQNSTNLNGRQDGGSVVGGRIVVALAIHLQETVEEDDLSRSDKLLAVGRHVNVHIGAFQLCISHLRSDGALPNQLIEATLISGAFDGMLVKIGRTDGFVSFLGTLALGVVLACLDILGTIVGGNFLLGHAEGEARKVDRVGTHIGNFSRFVKLLGDAHGVGHRKAQFSCGLLLQGGGSERWCRIAHGGFLLDAVDLIARIDARLQELACFFLCIKAMRQLGEQVVFLSVSYEGELCDHAVGTALHKILDFLLALDDEAHSHRLHTTRRKRWLHFFPQKWRKLIANQAVEHTTCLLRIDETHIDFPRIFHRVLDGCFGDFVENDALCVLFLQVKHLIKMPRDGFSLAVLIGCKPHCISILSQFP